MSITAIPQTMMYQPQMVGAQSATLPMMQQQVLPLGAMGDAGGQAAVGALAAKPKSSLGTIVKSVLGTGALGAGIGAAMTFLPFIPGGPITGAIVGGIAGAALGLIRGVRHARRQQDEQRALMMGSMNVPTDPRLLGPEMPLEAAAAAKAARPHAAAKPKPRKVKVRSGDTLSKIARAHHVTVAELAAANRSTLGRNINVLRVGQTLVIPRHHKKHA